VDYVSSLQSLIDVTLVSNTVFSNAIRRTKVKLQITCKM